MGIIFLKSKIKGVKKWGISDNFGLSDYRSNSMVENLVNILLEYSNHKLKGQNHIRQPRKRPQQLSY